MTDKLPDWVPPPLTGEEWRNRPRFHPNPDPLRPPEPDPEPRRSGCALALILGALAWLAVLVIFALGFFVRGLVG